MKIWDTCVDVILSRTDSSSYTRTDEILNWINSTPDCPESMYRWRENIPCFIQTVFSVMMCLKSAAELEPVENFRTQPNRPVSNFNPTQPNPTQPNPTQPNRLGRLSLGFNRWKNRREPAKNRCAFQNFSGISETGFGKSCKWSNTRKSGIASWLKVFHHMRKTSSSWNLCWKSRKKTIFFSVLNRAKNRSRPAGWKVQPNLTGDRSTGRLGAGSPVGFQLWSAGDGWQNFQSQSCGYD